MSFRTKLVRPVLALCCAFRLDTGISGPSACEEARIVLLTYRSVHLPPLLLDDALCADVSTSKAKLRMRSSSMSMMSAAANFRENYSLRVILSKRLFKASNLILSRMPARRLVHRPAFAHTSTSNSLGLVGHGLFFQHMQLTSLTLFISIRMLADGDGMCHTCRELHIQHLHFSLHVLLFSCKDCLFLHRLILLSNLPGIHLALVSIAPFISLAEDWPKGSPRSYHLSHDLPPS